MIDWILILQAGVASGTVLLFAAIGELLAGREIQPSGVPRMLQGIILFTIIASDVVLRYRIRIIRE